LVIIIGLIKFKIMKRTEISNLYDSIISLHTITCGKCGKEDTVMSDDAWGAADDFYEHGWRTTNDDVYCKTCSKKKPKKKPRSK